MGTNNVPLVARQLIPVRVFSDEDIEVIEPEIGHHFLELALAVGCAQNLSVQEFFGDKLLRILNGHCGLALVRGQAIEKLIARWTLQTSQKANLLSGR